MNGRYRSGAGARRVLIIEDNADAAESLCALLRLCGHAAEVALTGADGIELARTFLPDVVLCDLGMPEMDGLRVAEALREDPRLRGVRLIALTGYGRPEDVARAVRAGFDSHITKPADPEQILRVIQA